MKTIRVLDIGGTFGMDGDRLFRGWERQFGTALEMVRVHQNSAMADVKANIKDVDLVYFGGGADVHPALYGHKNVASMVGHLPSLRDVFERQVFQDAVELNIPIFGICRGAQLLCALSGGSLIQDVEGHAGGDHMLTVVNADTGRKEEAFSIPSTHHQMMNIDNINDADLLAWTAPRSRKYIRDTNKVPHRDGTFDPEIVYFSNTNALAVQGHPEYYDTDSLTSCIVRQMICDYNFQGRH